MRIHDSSEHGQQSSYWRERVQALISRWPLSVVGLLGLAYSVASRASTMQLIFSVLHDASKALSTPIGSCLASLLWLGGVIFIPPWHKTPTHKKLTIFPASSDYCLEIDGNRGRVIVRLSIFSAVRLNLYHIDAQLGTGNLPDAVPLELNTPKVIEQFDRTRIELSEGVNPESRQALTDATQATIKGTAYFRTDRGEEIEKEFKLAPLCRKFPEPFRWAS